MSKKYQLSKQKKNIKKCLIFFALSMLAFKIVWDTNFSIENRHWPTNIDFTSIKRKDAFYKHKIECVCRKAAGNKLKTWESSLKILNTQCGIEQKNSF